MKFEIKRIYEEVDKKDEMRILVDRLWPRGIKKEDAKIDMWLKDIAPSSELRKWFNHRPEKWAEFCERYHKELASKQEIIKNLLEVVKKHDVTLLYAAKDQKFNNAAALKTYLEHFGS